MKIVYVIDYYTPETSGFAEEVTKQLARRGHEVTVLTSNIQLYNSKDIKPIENIRIRRFSGKIIGERVIYPGLIKGVLQEKTDIMHAAGLGFFSSPVCGYIKPLKKFPFVLRADFNIYEKMNVKRRVFNFFWRQIPLSTADAVTVHIRKMKELLLERYNVNPEKIEIMPHGIEFERFNKAKGIRKSLGVDGRFVILNVSRADSSKDPNKIIRALPILKKIAKDFLFIHIGTYYQKEYYNKMIETIKSLGLEYNVRLMGKIPNEELPKYYKSADVYVQSSNEESFCLSTLEAMASGLPVVATKTGAIGYEWFDNYDYWFSTPEELGEKLAELYNDKQKRKKISAELTKIAENHDWKKNIVLLEKIYEKAVK